MMTVAEIGVDLLAGLFADTGLTVVLVGAGEAIPGSYWGESEAGLIRHRLFVRLDTPLHSALHEAAHYLCMDPARREVLDRDAGGDYAEEDAVCYLQVLLIDRIAALADPGRFNRQQLFADMDAWGYTFRLGSAQRWFESDAEDARLWLERYGMLGPDSAAPLRVAS
ncbi:MAG: hypothetical protein KJ049_00060 [Gammaproteobacteria bacterium]|jgi:hypothetical protein|nr:hypothetical protein [Gammaproteobacteria bacterium]